MVAAAQEPTWSFRVDQVVTPIADPVEKFDPGMAIDQRADTDSRQRYALRRIRRQGAAARGHAGAGRHPDLRRLRHLRQDLERVAGRASRPVYAAHRLATASLLLQPHACRSAATAGGSSTPTTCSTSSPRWQACARRRRRNGLLAPDPPGLPEAEAENISVSSWRTVASLLEEGRHAGADRTGRGHQVRRGRRISAGAPVELASMQPPGPTGAPGDASAPWQLIVRRGPISCSRAT